MAAEAGLAGSGVPAINSRASSYGLRRQHSHRISSSLLSSNVTLHFKSAALRCTRIFSVSTKS